MIEKQKKIMGDALLEALTQFDGSREELANRIDVPVDRITYWLNEAKEVPYFAATFIEYETGISRFDLSPSARKLKRKGYAKDEIDTEKVCISARVAQGEYLEKQIKKAKLKKDYVPIFKGQMRDFISKEVNLGSGKNYQRGLYITKNGIYNLIQKMDDGFPIDLCYQIAHLDGEKQKKFIFLDKKEARLQLDALNAKQNKKTPPKITPTIFTIIDAIFQNQTLQNIETLANKPVRTALLIWLCLQSQEQSSISEAEINSSFQQNFQCSTEECLQILKDNDYLNLNIRNLFI